MAITDTTRKGETAGTAAPREVTLNSTASGSLIVVGVSAWQSGSTPTISVADNVNGSYSSAFNVANGSTRGALFYFPNNAGGNLTITLTSTGADYSFYVHEFAGVATSSPLSGTANSATGTVSTANTGTIDPPDLDVLVVAVLMYNDSGTITENQGGQGFTLSNEFEGAGGQPGSMVFRIFSGDAGTPGHTWSLGGGSPSWTAGIQAFKPGPTDPVYAQTKYRFYRDDGSSLGEQA